MLENRCVEAQMATTSNKSKQFGTPVSPRKSIWSSSFSLDDNSSVCYICCAICVCFVCRVCCICCARCISAYIVYPAYAAYIRCAMHTSQCGIRITALCYTHKNGMLYAPDLHGIRTKTVCYTNQYTVYTHRNAVLCAPERSVTRISPKQCGTRTRTVCYTDQNSVIHIGMVFYALKRSAICTRVPC